MFPNGIQTKLSRTTLAGASRVSSSKKIDARLLGYFCTIKNGKEWQLGNLHERARWMVSYDLHDCNADLDIAMAAAREICITLIMNIV